MVNPKAFYISEVQKSEWSEYCCISIFGVFINGWMFTDGYIAAIRNLGHTWLFQKNKKKIHQNTGKHE
jgi:hypothetical protein